jgi:hypothetical protein
VPVSGTPVAGSRSSSASIVARYEALIRVSEALRAYQAFLSKVSQLFSARARDEQAALSLPAIQQGPVRTMTSHVPPLPS